jgi:hypothetical protein
MFGWISMMSEITIARGENSRERGRLVPARRAMMQRAQMIMIINTGKDKTSRTIFFMT